MTDQRRPHPDVTRALRAEICRVPGGHQREIQEDLEEITAVTARWLLNVLRERRNAQDKIARARSQPWRGLLP